MSLAVEGKVKVWSGYHSDELLQHLRNSWLNEELLVVCSPSVTDLSALKHIDLAKLSEKPVLGVFTSGTSRGEPSLVLYSKKNIESSLDEIFKLFDTSRIKTIFSYAQPFHTFGLLLGYIAAIRFGAKLVTPNGKYSHDAHERRLSCNDQNLLTLGTPTHFFDLLSYQKKTQREALPSYSCIIGGAPTSIALWKSVRDQLKIEQPSIGYGCTEASPGISHLPPGIVPKFDGEIGLPLENLKTDVTEDGLEISGPSLCIASISSEGMIVPQKRIIRDRVRVEISPRKTWVFEGRTDLVINRGGEKFFIENIERTLLPLLGPCVAVAVQDQRLGEDIGIVCKHPMKIESLLSAINEILQTSLGMKVSEENLKLVDQIPVNANGKTDRKSVAKMFEQLKFPVPTSSLSKWLPHRPPMVWVDEVTELTSEGGIAKVKLDESKLYFTDQHVRLSSLLEFVAQGYGYISICKKFDQLGNLSSENMRAYLAAMSGVEFSCEADDPALTKSKELRVEIHRSKPVGPIQIVEGTVSTPEGRKLLTTTMKVFSQ